MAELGGEEAIRVMRVGDKQLFMKQGRDLASH